MRTSPDGFSTPLERLAMSRNDRLDFVIAGAQKGGTTQISEHLSRVRGIWMRSQEDPAFETPHFETGSVQRLRYEIASRRAPGEVAGIKRASYLGIQPVPARIAQEFPEIKVVLVLRDPVDRAISAYLHKAQYGRVRLLPVSEAMAAILDGDDLGSPRTYEALAWSKYSELVPRWSEMFGESLIIVGNGDLRTDETQVLKLVTRHLEVEYNLIQPAPRETNIGARSTLELRLRRQMHRAITTVDPLTRQLGPRTNNPFRLGYGGVMRTASMAVSRYTAKKSPSLTVNTEVRRRLEAFFEDDYRYVKDHVGVGL